MITNTTALEQYNTDKLLNAAKRLNAYSEAALTHDGKNNNSEFLDQIDETLSFFGFKSERDQAIDCVEKLKKENEQLKALIKTLL